LGTDPDQLFWREKMRTSIKLLSLTALNKHEAVDFGRPDVYSSILDISVDINNEYYYVVTYKLRYTDSGKICNRIMNYPKEYYNLG
jgi:hypothetical protein